MKLIALIIAFTLSATAQDEAVTVVQDNGVWWFRSPTGANFLSIGANHVEPPEPASGKVGLIHNGDPEYIDQLEAWN